MSIEIDVSKRLRDIVLDVRLSVPDGKVLVLMGRNGSGKTTLLRLVAGLMSPDRGRIEVGGRTLFDSATGTDLPVETRNVGFMFQSYALFPHMSVLDNLAYGLRVRKLRNDEVMAVARPALEEHGLWEVRDVKAGKLSGGQRQRVAFLRAMVLRPDVFLLDEPLSAMDGSMQESVRKGIRNMASSTGTPCILVTHNREDAAELGDIICYMEGGKIVRSHRAGEEACTCRRPDAFISSQPEPGAGRQGSNGRPIRSIHELKSQSDESRAEKPSFLSDTLYPVRRP